MYGPDSYLYETNLTMLATLTDEELSDAELIAQLAPGTAALNAVGAWMAAALGRGLAAVAEWFAPPVVSDEQAAAYWVYPPIC
ncbi:MAG TPA: hypothetical protein PKD53_23360 [Chloroflexaceae bacterium]|nr:hypothetical protein [Chloroflexaceae bacterium]